MSMGMMVRSGRETGKVTCLWCIDNFFENYEKIADRNKVLKNKLILFRLGIIIFLVYKI